MERLREQPRNGWRALCESVAMSVSRRFSWCCALTTQEAEDSVTQESATPRSSHCEGCALGSQQCAECSAPRLHLVDWGFVMVMLATILQLLPTLVSCFFGQWISCDFTAAQVSFGLGQIKLHLRPHRFQLQIYRLSASYTVVADQDIQGTSALMLTAYGVLVAIVVGFGSGVVATIVSVVGFSEDDEKSKLERVQSVSCLMLVNTICRGIAIFIFGICVPRVLASMTLKDVMLRVVEIDDPASPETALILRILEQRFICSSEVQSWKAGAILETISFAIALIATLATISTSRITVEHAAELAFTESALGTSMVPLAAPATHEQNTHEQNGQSDGYGNHQKIQHDMFAPM